VLRLELIARSFRSDACERWPSFRTFCGSLLRKYASLLTLALFIVVTALLVISNTSASRPIMVVATGLCINTAFVTGYALRMRSRWPTLREFQRSEYAQVWDALSTTPLEAEAAAAGITGESALRASGLKIAMRIARASSIKKTEDVLEIGCGVGRVGWGVASLCRSWIGCDVSGKMIRHARNRLDGITNASFVQLKQSGLKEIKSTSMDVVYCTNALPHLDQAERWLYVREAYRVLRPGGRLYIDTVALDSPEGWSMIENNLAQKACGINPPYAPTPSSPDEVVAYYTKAGFSRSSVLHQNSLISLVGVK
jgi:SAM-dependent methyltransferase